MGSAVEKPGDVFDIGHMRSRLSRHLNTIQPGGSVEPSEQKPAKGDGASRWQSAALFLICLFLLGTMAVAIQAFHQVGKLEELIAESLDGVEGRMQHIESSVAFDSRQNQLLLGMRDEIMRVNPRVSLADAYRLSELVLRASEKYPSVDPLMLLSLGIVESAYKSRAVSHANARGLYQILPSTGRLLALALGWEYTDDMLYDPERNTEMAALYLDILFATYNDVKMVLAEYNGGPINAGYLRAGSKRTARETKDYVPKVLKNYERLKQKFERGVDVQLDMMHKDATRDGKRLSAGMPGSDGGARNQQAGISSSALDEK